MSDEVSRLIEQRAVMRAAITCLAEPLTGEERERFLTAAEDRLGKTLPAPGRHHMRMYLKAVPD